MQDVAMPGPARRDRAPHGLAPHGLVKAGRGLAATRMAPRGEARKEGEWHTSGFESRAPTHGLSGSGGADRGTAWLRWVWHGWVPLGRARLGVWRVAGRHRGSSPRHPRTVGHGTGNAGPGSARLVAAPRRKAGQGMGTTAELARLLGKEA